MAGLRKDERTGTWLIDFRFGGKRFLRSTETDSERIAESVRGKVEETIRLLTQGRIEMPPGAEPGLWIVSGGKLDSKPTVNVVGFAEVCAGYVADQHQKKGTAYTEGIHIGHLKRILGGATRFAGLTVKEMQGYVNARHKEEWRGEPIGGETIHKELVTFGKIWKWATVRGMVTGQNPCKNAAGGRAVNLPEGDDQIPFMTLPDAQRRLAAEGLTKKRRLAIRRSIFLDAEQVAKLLRHIEKKGGEPVAYPLFVFVARTGARRSEACRSLVNHISFSRNEIEIVEQKRKRGVKESTRIVPLHSELATVLKSWQSGGPYTFGGAEALDRDVAHRLFKAAVEGTEFEALAGFHNLRHTFGANCLRAGVPRDMTGKWMGHTSEEMKDLYQHLFPDDEQAMIKRVP
jgi:integrase